MKLGQCFTIRLAQRHHAQSPCSPPMSPHRRQPWRQICRASQPLANGTTHRRPGSLNCFGRRGWPLAASSASVECMLAQLGEPSASHRGLKGVMARFRGNGESISPTFGRDRRKLKTSHAAWIPGDAWPQNTVPVSQEMPTECPSHERVLHHECVMPGLHCGRQVSVQEPRPRCSGHMYARRVHSEKR